MTRLHKHFDANTTGRDFFVGDIHGTYALLMDHLARVNFNPDTDRLFSVGDLADRGPSSYEVVKLIEQPWFHAVRGNHDDMAIRVVTGDWPLGNFIENGGEWFTKLTEDQQFEVVDLLAQLPLTMEVVVGGKRIGIIHGDCYGDWTQYVSGLASQSLESTLWGRQRIRMGDKQRVDGVDLVVCGHTVVNDVTQLGNVLYIDTGAVFSGRYKDKDYKMTLIEGSELVQKYIDVQENEQ